MRQPVSTTMLPLQGLQGAQVNLLSQPGNAMLHRQVSNCTLPIPCTNSTPPQFLLPQCQAYASSSDPTSHVISSSAINPQRSLSIQHSTAAPPSFENVPCPTPIGCASNRSIVFSQNRLWMPTADDNRTQQGHEPAPVIDHSSLFLWSSNPRIVSPDSGNNPSELPILQLGAPMMNVVGAENEDQSIASLFPFDSMQDGFGWNDTLLFPE